MSERTFQFALRVRLFLKKLLHGIINEVDGKQLVKASGSVGASYLEANDALGDADFRFRLKILRKEAKESRFWLRLIRGTNDARFHSEADELIAEAVALKKILSQMLINHTPRKNKRLTV